MKTEIDDCGRAPGEKRDCVVRALAKCLSIPYGEAHAIAEKAGRKPKSGCHMRQVAALVGLEIRPDLSCRRFGKIASELSSGRFIVRVSRHVFAVVDGVAFDLIEVADNKTVKMVYQYTPKL